MSTLQPNPLPELEENSTTSQRSGMVKCKGANKLLLISLFLFTAALFTAIGVGGYYLTDKNNSEKKEANTQGNIQENPEEKIPETEESDEQENIETEEVDTSEDSKNYTSPQTTVGDTKFSLQYPASWELNATTEKDPSGEISSLVVEISKDLYTLHIVQSATGSSDCIFNKDKLGSSPYEIDLTEIEYDEVESKLGTLRYFRGWHSDKDRFDFCQLVSKETDSYEWKTEIGGIFVTAPQDYDQEEMNAIISIVESIEEV